MTQEKHPDYIGEYFMAVWSGSESSGYRYALMQMHPLLNVGYTERHDLAVQLVNRLDVTGAEPIEAEE